MKNYLLGTVLIAIALGVCGCPAPDINHGQNNGEIRQTLTFGPKQTGTQPITLHDKPMTMANPTTVGGLKFGKSATWSIACIITPKVSTATIRSLSVKLDPFGPLSSTPSGSSRVTFSASGGTVSGSTITFNNPSSVDSNGFILIPIEIKIMADQRGGISNARCVIDALVAVTDSNGVNYTATLLANTANLTFN